MGTGYFSTILLNYPCIAVKTKSYSLLKNGVAHNQLISPSQLLSERGITLLSSISG
jgi:hypothetical protein